MTELSFSVNKAVVLQGVTLYGGTDPSYKYKVVLNEQGVVSKTLVESEGSFSQSDYYGESFVNVLFKQPARLQVPEVTQILWFHSCMCTQQ